MSNKNAMKNRNDNKIPVSEFEKAVRGAQEQFHDVQWNGLKLRIRHALNLEYMMRYVEYIVRSCFDSNTGEYRPEIKDFAIRSGAIKFFTNVTLPSEAGKQYRLLYGTDIVNIVMSYVDAGQMNNILIAADKKIDYIASEGIEKIQKQFDEAVKSLSELSKNMENIFGGVSVNDINNLVGAIANGSLDEDRLVDAIAKKNLVNSDE